MKQHPAIERCKETERPYLVGLEEQGRDILLLTQCVQQLAPAKISRVWTDQQREFMMFQRILDSKLRNAVIPLKEDRDFIARVQMGISVEWLMLGEKAEHLSEATNEAKEFLNRRNNILNHFQEIVARVAQPLVLPIIQPAMEQI